MVNELSAKEKSVKCAKCKKVVKKEDAIKKSNKYYHSECIQLMEDYKELIEYICSLYNLSAPSGMILNQIKTFAEEYSFKYRGMQLALIYFHETLDNKVREGDGIGIILYVYEEAKNHYIKQQKIADSIDNIKNEEMVIYIDTDKTKRESKKIDISAI